MEGESGTNPFSFSISEYLIGFHFFQPILNSFRRFTKKSLPLLNSIACSVTQQLLTPTAMETESPKDEVAVSMRAEELEALLRSMGLTCDQEGKSGDVEGFDGDLISTFEEQEPSLEEVQDAFTVFDRNGDGYIEAHELGAVLRLLGLREEASSPEKCERMIEAFDGNGDGRIDLHEFAKIMERCLS